MVKFFEWRSCRGADTLADIALDRVMSKIEAGEQIVDPVKYAYGVSRLVYLESLKNPVKEQEVNDRLSLITASNENDLQMDCLEKCLGELGARSHEMVLAYYSEQKQNKIEHRKQLADRLRISVNALRIKVLRIRSTLESCVLKCTGDGSI